MVKFKLLLESILMEGRVDDFKAKYSSLDPKIQQSLIQNDPSSNHKYLDWMGRAVVNTPELDISSLIKDLTEFDKYNLGDIYSFKSYTDLKSYLVSRTKSNLQQKREGATILLDNNEFLIVAPFTSEGASYYGNNTRWCIAGSESWWDKYYHKSSIIIVLDKRNKDKYAVVAEYDDGDPDLYDENDHRLNYSTVVGDGEFDWPEEVHEIINNYISSDDRERRRESHYSKLISDFMTENGKDYVLHSYLDAIKTENDINIYSDDESIKVDIVSYKDIANKNGVSDEEIDNIQYSYLYENLREDDGEVGVNFGDISSVKSFEDRIREIGNVSVQELEKIRREYINYKRGDDSAYEILKSTMNRSEYDRLYNIEKLDTQLSDAIIKYNNMLNSSDQMTFPDAPKMAVKIKSIHDIIYILKKTGHEVLASQIETASGLYESLKMKRLVNIKSKKYN